MVVFFSKVYCHLKFEEILGEFSTLEVRTVLCLYYSYQN